MVVVAKDTSESQETKILSKKIYNKSEKGDNKKSVYQNAMGRRRRWNLLI